MNAFFEELFHSRIYKRSQGRITRQVTFFAMAIALIAVAYRLSDTMSETKPALYLGVPGLLILLGVWVCYRIVNLPAFADFLIAVEAEMNKVSWPSRGELYRHSVVVLVVLFMLTVVLFGFDIAWAKVFQVLRIIPR
jgi:preprotein translocase subunit SecE